MENEGVREEKTEEGKRETKAKRNTESSIQFRVVISEEANRQLESAMTKVTSGTDPFELNKSDLANYVFCNLERLLNDSDFKTLRSQHFDERVVLKDLLKRTGDDQELPEELRRVLREYYGVADKEKKRSSKTNTSSPGER